MLQKNLVFLNLLNLEGNIGWIDEKNYQKRFMKILKI